MSLMEQSHAAALVYRRADQGFDREPYAGLDAIVPLPEIACQLPLAEVDDNLSFTPPPSDDEKE